MFSDFLLLLAEEWNLDSRVVQVWSVLQPLKLLFHIEKQVILSNQSCIAVYCRFSRTHARNNRLEQNSTLSDGIFPFIHEKYVRHSFK